MNRPAFQFYTKDWRSNSKLRRCSPAARGVWIDILCALHDSDEYGIARYPLKELANEVGASIALLRELVEKGVLKGADQGAIDAFVYVPRSGRKDGAPVTLLPVQPGPIWYSSRMVKDEHVRTVRGEATRFGDDNGEPPNGAPKLAPKPPISDGSSTASPSPPPGKETSKLTLAPARPPAEPPDCPHREILALWAEVLPAMPQHDPERWRGAKADHLRVRWRETAVAKGWADKAAGLEYFRKLFAYVGRSEFLTGRAPSTPGKRPFVIELEWLANLANWDKVHEGKYHPEAA